MLRSSATRFVSLFNVTKYSSLSRACFCTPATARSMTEENLETMRARLLYQSKKRGILENDILIGDFGEKYLNKMDRETLKEYDTLINGDIMEWDLYYYMSGKEEPPAEVAKSTAFQLLKKFVDEKEFAKDVRATKS
ncbi:TPR repeat region [Teladorsagia circumcincta]|uniref:Succinate dehydrogenase assembly factor 2, mitochondrial n=1 Tax=Teladorsagia circumcincta TaxID=45464 RepID=A0A2G9U2W6_TELCI|nr:TPR repeat region [Teladorsagia circumcincta]